MLKFFLKVFKCIKQHIVYNEKVAAFFFLASSSTTSVGEIVCIEFIDNNANSFSLL